VPAWHAAQFPISFWPRTVRPGALFVESCVPEATVDALRDRGHIIEVGPDWSEGRLTAASTVGRRRAQLPIRLAFRAMRQGDRDTDEPVDHRRSSPGVKWKLPALQRSIKNTNTHKITRRKIFFRYC
jgi:hypothetical protein